MNDSIATVPLGKSIYPAGLLTWAGHRQGGVKDPFNRNTGRPAQVRVKTPLVERLSDWVQRLIGGESVPRVILLVGGPGNGKTDTVEGIIDDLDQSLQLSGRLFDEFGRQYSDSDPYRSRCMQVSLASIIENCPEHLDCNLSLVQDASEADTIEFPELNRTQILLADLERVTAEDSKEIYICCVNRGILAEAFTEIQKTNASGIVADLVEDMTHAVTNSPYAKPCWPLERFQNVVSWPMDVDSLVESQDGLEVPFEVVLKRALDETKWPQDCPAGQMCPFCTNRRLLSKEGTIESLSEMLRAFELATSKRWSFRDLYSLVTYILVGNEDALIIDGKSYDPCDWAAEQVKFIGSNSRKDEVKKSRALYLLSSALYWHRLFPSWPRLATKAYTEAEREIVGKLNGDLLFIKDFFRYTRWTGRSKITSSLQNVISNSFSKLFDPADADSEQEISIATTRNLTVQEIDGCFSLSIEQGLSKVTQRITPIEREILKRLLAAEKALEADSASKNQAKAELLKRTLRLYSARLVKRSLGVQSGCFAQRETIRGFKKAFSDPIALRNVRGELRELLNKNNFFVSSLMSTFAQPPLPEDRNVMIETSGVRVVPWKYDAVDRPSSQQIYLKVDGSPVPITYDLFEALTKLSKGMLKGSLSDETLAMVDRINAKIAGAVVRDEERWFDDTTSIAVKAANVRIQYVEGEFCVEFLDEQ